MTTRLNEIKLDINELNNLLEHATRQKSKDILSLEVRRLQTELINLQNQLSKKEENSEQKTSSNTSNKTYETKINNYAWDQTDEYVKLYVTMQNIHALSKEAITCNFNVRSFDLHIQGLDDKNYVLLINNLCEDIDVTKSHFKVKSDMIVIYLSKKSKNEWSCVTNVEKRLKDAKTTTPLTDTSNPSASLMDLMRRMYTEGNDDIKRTIAKAWTESQEKKFSLGDDL